MDLPIPAHAEIVIEGEVDADKFMHEGPFGEYTGYYSGVGTDPRNFIDVKCVTFRNNPILWGTTVGRAVTDTHMTMALSYGATLWQQLVDMKIPGIRSVYCPPEGSGRFLAIISMKQMYPGHADQVLTAAISTEMGAYGLKTVIVVDEDIDPWDIPRVMYALSFRFQPNRSQVIKRGRSTPLDPSLPIDAREITGRLLLDATIPYDWKEKPIPIELDPEMVKKVEARWSELGSRGWGLFVLHVSDLRAGCGLAGARRPLPHNSVRSKIMPGSMVSGKKILAVDDELDILEVLEEMLPMCDVVKAKSFETARDLLETQTFDIVILDIMGVRGYDLLEIANKRKIPAVMLTAHAFSPKDLRKSIKEGAVAYIPKEEITHIKEFLNDVLAAREKGENPWKYWDERLPSSYFERRWGSTWQNTDQAFWENFKASIKARGERADKKDPSKS